MRSDFSLNNRSIDSTTQGEKHTRILVQGTFAAQRTDPLPCGAFTTNTYQYLSFVHSVWSAHTATVEDFIIFKGRGLGKTNRILVPVTSSGPEAV